MSGHSKWAQIKRQKGVNDARRGQLFTKLGREISVAAREGGPDPDGNFRLRLAMQRARESNMPLENIERAIKRGVGSSEGATFEEMTYEGYGPGGVAVMVRTLTDNRNRTVADIRSIFTRGGGNLAESGSVAWIFRPRGIVQVELGSRDADDVSLAAIDAGADDVALDGDQLTVFTEPGDLETVRQALERAGIAVASSEQSMVPSTTLEPDERAAEMAIRLIERLEDHDDVQSVYSNLELSDQVAERFAS